MNVFPAVVNATKFQEQQKTFVIHFLLSFNTLSLSPYSGVRLGALVGIWNMKVLSRTLYTAGSQAPKEKCVLGRVRDARSTESPSPVEWVWGEVGLRAFREGSHGLVVAR